MLHQLDQNQPLSQAAGVMLGVFTKSESRDNEASLPMLDVFSQHLGQLKSPSVYGYSFGHIPHQFTIPVGIRARLDTSAETLTLLESAVV